jgi:hypothetical protein
MPAFLPLDVVEAAVSAIGKVFYYKSSLKALLRRAGVSNGWFERYSADTKYAIARHVFGDLELRGESGRKVAIRIIQELCAIRKPADDLVDKAAALSALSELRTLSHQARIEDAREEVSREKRQAEQTKRVEAITRHERVLVQCYAKYQTLLAETDFQKRGYALEELFKELFLAHEIHYTPSFKAVSEQIDGAFRFASFDYLVETKWTRSEASLAALDTFKAKVDRRLASTRGLFLSIASFDAGVVASFESGAGRNVILMSGEDLALILEGRVSLTDALDLKTTQAAQKGRLFVPLRDHT